MDMSNDRTGRKWGHLYWLPRVVLAIRTAKWPPRSSGGTTSDRELEVEIENAVHLVGRLMSTLVSRHETIFPRKNAPWFMPNDEDVPE